MSFHWEMTLFLLAGALDVGSALYAFSRREVPAARLIGLLAAAAGLWAFVYTLAIGADTLEDKYLWVRVGYLGAVPSLAIGVVVALEITGLCARTPRWVTPSLLLWGLTVLTLVWTNDLHGWFWTDFYLEAHKLEWTPVHGPAFGAWQWGAVALVLAMAAIYARHLFTAPPLYRVQALLLLLAAMLPVLFRLVQIGLGVVVLERVDQVPLLSCASAVLVAAAVFAYGAADVLPIARRLVIDTLQNGVLFVDPQRRVLAMNPWATERWQAEEPVGRPLEEVLPEYGHRELADGDQWLMRREPQHAVGEESWYLAQVTEVRQPRLGLVCHAIVLVDITAMKAAEASARAAVETRDRFLASVSHELRTPLHATLALLRLLEKTPLTEDQLAYLHRADVSARSLTALIDDILDLARLQTGRLEIRAVPCDLAAVLEEVRTITEVRAHDAGVDLDFTATLPDTPVRADPLRLTQVLLNLLSNAVKFSPGGSVRLEVHAGSGADGDADAENVNVSFAVTDTGVGMDLDDAQLQALFEPFVQEDEETRRRFGGTGLGLSIVREVVEAMGGRVSVQTTPGEGSTFSFSLSLPRVTDGVPLSASAVDPSALRGRRVLVVDDASINRMVAEQMLDAAGMVVETAASGAEALEFLAGTPVDAVLMDVHMPGLDGMETTRRIRRMAGREGLPVIAMTAAVLEADRQRAAEAGMNAFLGKPFEAEEAFAVLVECLATEASEHDAAPGDSPAPPGRDLDAERGLKLVRGNAALYADLLGQFEAELATFLGDDAAAIEALLADVDAIHRIKGTAAILGAEVLSAATAELEAALREGREDREAADAVRAAVPAFAAARSRYLAEAGTV